MRIVVTETQQLVDARFLSGMRPASLVVNVARGAPVDEEALVVALGAGRTLEAAVLDVTRVEPLPHDAAGGVGRFARAADLLVENLRRYEAGEPMLHEVEAADLPAAG